MTSVVWFWKLTSLPTYVVVKAILASTSGFSNLRGKARSVLTECAFAWFTGANLKWLCEGPAGT